jgi:hypothetical protein
MGKYDSVLTGSLFQTPASQTAIAHARDYAVMSVNTHKNILRSQSKRRARNEMFLLLFICASQIFATTSSFSQTTPTFAEQANKCSAAQRYCAWGCNARINNCSLCDIDFSQCINRARSNVSFAKN